MKSWFLGDRSANIPRSDHEIRKDFEELKSSKVLQQKARTEKLSTLVGQTRNSELVKSIVLHIIDNLDPNEIDDWAQDSPVFNSRIIESLLNILSMFEDLSYSLLPKILLFLSKTVPRSLENARAFLSQGGLNEVLQLSLEETDDLVITDLIHQLIKVSCLSQHVLETPDPVFSGLLRVLSDAILRIDIPSHIRSVCGQAMVHLLRDCKDENKVRLGIKTCQNPETFLHYIEPFRGALTHANFSFVVSNLTIVALSISRYPENHEISFAQAISSGILELVKELASSIKEADESKIQEWLELAIIVSELAFVGEGPTPHTTSERPLRHQAPLRALTNVLVSETTCESAKRVALEALQRASSFDHIGFAHTSVLRGICLGLQNVPVSLIHTALLLLEFTIMETQIVPDDEIRILRKILPKLSFEKQRVLLRFVKSVILIDSKCQLIFAQTGMTSACFRALQTHWKTEPDLSLEYCETLKPLVECNFNAVCSLGARLTSSNSSSPSAANESHRDTESEMKPCQVFSWLISCWTTQKSSVPRMHNAITNLLEEVLMSTLDYEYIDDTSSEAMVQSILQLLETPEFDVEAIRFISRLLLLETNGASRLEFIFCRLDGVTLLFQCVERLDTIEDLLRFQCILVALNRVLSLNLRERARWNQSGCIEMMHRMRQSPLLRSKEHRPLILPIVTCLLCRLAVGDMKRIREFSTSTSLNDLPFPSASRFHNPSALCVAVQWAQECSISFQCKFLDFMHQCIELFPTNITTLSHADGFLTQLLLQYKNVLFDSSHPWYEGVLSLIGDLVRHRPGSHDMHQLHTLLKEKDWPQALNSIMKMLAPSTKLPYIEIDTREHVFAFIQGQTSNRTWPSSAGYSISLWLYLSEIDTERKTPVLELSTYLDEREIEKSTTSALELGFHPKGHLLVTKDRKQTIEFEQCQISPNQWHHVAVVHEKRIIQTSLIHLYINGNRIQQEKLSYYSPNKASIGTRVTLGVPVASVSSRNNQSDEHPKCCIRFAAFSLFSIPLDANSIYRIRNRGAQHCVDGGSLVVQDILEGYRDFRARLEICLADEYPVTGTAHPQPLEDSSPVSSGVLAESNSVVFSYHASNWFTTPVVVSRSPSDTKRDMIQRDSKDGGSTKVRNKRRRSSIEDAYLDQHTVVGTAVVLVNSGAPGRSSHALLHGAASIHSPLGMANSLTQIGGAKILFPLIEKCTQSVELNACLECMLLMMRDSAAALRDFEAEQLYPLLGYLLHRKSEILNRRTVELLFFLVGISKDGKRGSIFNIEALRALVLNSIIWRDASVGVYSTVFDVLTRAISTQNPSYLINREVLISSYAVQWLLSLLSGGGLLRHVNLLKSAVKLLHILCVECGKSHRKEVSHLLADSATGSFQVTQQSVSIDLMRDKSKIDVIRSLDEVNPINDSIADPAKRYSIWLRNQYLQTIHTSVIQARINEETSNLLALFSQGGPLEASFLMCMIDGAGAPDRTTATIALELFCILLSSQPKRVIKKFQNNRSFELLAVILHPFAACPEVYSVLLHVMAGLEYWECIGYNNPVRVSDLQANLLAALKENKGNERMRRLQEAMEECSVLLLALIAGVGRDEEKYRPFHHVSPARSKSVFSSLHNQQRRSSTPNAVLPSEPVAIEDMDDSSAGTTLGIRRWSDLTPSEGHQSFDFASKPSKPAVDYSTLPSQMSATSMVTIIKCFDSLVHEIPALKTVELIRPLAWAIYGQTYLFLEKAKADEAVSEERKYLRRKSIEEPDLPEFLSDLPKQWKLVKHFHTPISYAVQQILVGIVWRHLRESSNGFRSLVLALEQVGPTTSTLHRLAYQTHLLLSLTERIDTLALLPHEFSRYPDLAGNLYRYLNIISQHLRHGLFVLDPVTLLPTIARIQQRLQNHYLGLNFLDLWSSISLQLYVSRPTIASVLQLNEVISSFILDNEEFYRCLGYHLIDQLLHDDELVQLSATQVWRSLIHNAPDTTRRLLQISRDRPPDTIFSDTTPVVVQSLYVDGFDQLSGERDLRLFVEWVKKNRFVLKQVQTENFLPSWIALFESENKARDEDQKLVHDYNVAVLREVESYQRRIELISQRYRETEQTLVDRLRRVRDRELVRMLAVRETHSSQIKDRSGEWRNRKKVMKLQKLIAGTDEQASQWNEPRNIFQDYITTKWTLDFVEGPFRIKRKLQTVHQIPVDDLVVDTAVTEPIDSSQDQGQLPSIRGRSRSEDGGIRYAPQLVVQPVNERQISQSIPTTPTAAPLKPSPSSSHFLALDSRRSRRNRSRILSTHGMPGDLAAISLAEEVNDSSQVSNQQTVAESETNVANLNDEWWLWGDHSIQIYLDSDEEVLSFYGCLTVRGLEETSSITILTDRAFHLLIGYQVTETGDIVPISSDGQIEHRRCSFYEFSRVRRRRYLLQPAALDLSLIDGTNFLLVFAGKDRDEVFSLLLRSYSMLLQQNEEGQDIVYGAENALNDTSTTAVVSTISRGRLPRITGSRASDTLLDPMLEKGALHRVTKEWQKGRLTNFEYLMCINSIADRTFNDLAQYPVFPWILRDYQSSLLDLTNPEAFRDLAKPVGALNERRALEFKRRYDTWDDDKVPPFHYGTHYSSAAVALGYLVRLEPYTEQFRRFQGGKFDHADRMFSSISEAWRLATDGGSTSDVRELVGEFFYLPEFLLNGNHLNLGIRQSNNESVGDVDLPKWCNGSAREFIRLHRQALESVAVSSRLSYWIDLIFGYKQRGKPAVDALNVFYHLTYDDQVNFESIEDPVERAAALEQVRSFGQTPPQLFSRPHPFLEKMRKRSKLLLYAQRIEPQWDYSFPQPIGCMKYTMSTKRLVYYLGKPDRCGMVPGTTELAMTWGHEDDTLRFVAPDTIDTSRATGDTSEISPSPGRSDAESVYRSMHMGLVSCVSAAENGTFLVTGGADTKVHLWRRIRHRQARGMERTTKLLHSLTFGGKSSKNQKYILQGILEGHRDVIHSLDVCKEFSLVASASRDQTVFVWDVARKQIIACFRGFSSDIVRVQFDKVSGDLCVATETVLYLYDVNCKYLAKSERDLPLITCLSLYPCPDIQGLRYSTCYITGHENGTIMLWGMIWIPQTQKYELEIQTVLEQSNSPITSILMEKDGNLLWTADANGTLRQWHVTEEVEYKVILEEIVKHLEIPEEEAVALPCAYCSKKFRVAEVRSYCRYCRVVLCESCVLPHWREDTKHEPSPL